MTVSNRFLAELKDIKAVRFTCRNCKASFGVVPTDVRDDSFYRCYNCKAEFFEHKTENLKAMRDIFGGIASLEPRLGELKCTIQLEFEQP